MTLKAEKKKKNINKKYRQTGRESGRQNISEWQIRGSRLNTKFVVLEEGGGRL